jgi:DnaJ-class molecular chaperone
MIELNYDERKRKQNIDKGLPLCDRCNGTGNELFGMYRACRDCGGSGVDKRDQQKTVRYKMCPELSDGTSYSIVSTKEKVMEAMDVWLTEHETYLGEKLTIETIEMTDEEYRALPEI